jgi:hypothetical protein
LYHRAVERTQISLTRDQAAWLRRLARERGTSMAALIRQAIGEAYPQVPEPSRDDLWRRALEVVGKYRSGLPDLAERHDDYLNEFGRW